MYISDNLTNASRAPAVRARLASLTSALHVEEHANVVVFLVYLTRDESVIEQLVDHAKSMFRDVAPCALDADLAFANQLVGAGPKLLLPDGDAGSRREAYKESLDRDGAELGHPKEGTNDDDDLNDALRVNGALKAVQMMGQILRSFPGALLGDTKFMIAREAELLGRRVLTFVLELMKSQSTELKAWAEELLREYKGLTDPRELSERSEALLFNLILGLSYGVVKRLSEAVGSEHLQETYKDLRRQDESVALELIDVSIKLDHFRGYPETEVLALRSRIRRNLFSTSLLRRLVRDHFYLFPVEYTIRQRVCAELEITIDQPRMLMDSARRIGPVETQKRRKRRGKRKGKRGGSR